MHADNKLVRNHLVQVCAAPSAASLNFLLGYVGIGICVLYRYLSSTSTSSRPTSRRRPRFVISYVLFGYLLVWGSSELLVKYYLYLSGDRRAFKYFHYTVFPLELGKLPRLVSYPPGGPRAPRELLGEQAAVSSQ